MNQNLYQVLEISAKASQQEITSSYRRLAKTWHPDKNQHRLVEAEAKFKEISQAYSILNDPEKRQLFDRFGFEAVNGSAGPGPGSMPDIFAQMFAGMPGRGRGRSSEMPFGPGVHFQNFRGRPDPLAQYQILTHQIPVTLADLYQGREVDFKIRKRIRKPIPREIDANNSDSETDPEPVKYQVVMDTIFQKFKVIPGMTYHQQYQLQGQGHYLDENRQFGHLIIVLVPPPNEPSKFKLLANQNPMVAQNLFYALEISLKQAICGFSLPIIHLDGAILVIESQGISDLGVRDESGELLLNNRQRRLVGYGMPSLNIQNRSGTATRTKGDLYLELKIILPESENLNLKTLAQAIPDQALDKKYTVKKEHRVCRLSELPIEENSEDSDQESDHDSGPGLGHGPGPGPGVECRTQ